MNTKLKTIRSKPQLSRVTGDPAVNALKYTWPTLKLTLTVLAKTLDGIPVHGLKGVIGGFLKFTKTAEWDQLGNGARLLTTCSGIDSELRGCP
jgi:hypothetical protein